MLNEARSSVPQPTTGPVQRVSLILEWACECNEVDSEPPTISNPSSAMRLSNELLDTAYIRRNPQCIHALAIVPLFQDPPSVLQVSRVENLNPEHLLTMLRPIEVHLAQPLVDIYSVVALKEPLKTWIFDRARYRGLPVDRAGCHERVARWCLADTSTSDARYVPLVDQKPGLTDHCSDIEYGTRNWLYHVCQSIPSQALWDAIRASRFVKLPSWNNKFKEIQTWIEIDVRLESHIT